MPTSKEGTFGEGGPGGNAKVRGNNSNARGGPGGEGVVGAGGKGGDADVAGNNSAGFGGPGGRGGISQGSPGGDAIVRSDNMTYAGGEGGEAPQHDGRGGRGGKSSFVKTGLPDLQLPDGSWVSDYGRGGDGGHSPQYAARLMVLEEMLGRQLDMRAASAGLGGVEANETALHQLNERLRRAGYAWRVRVTADCFEFYDI